MLKRGFVQTAVQIPGGRLALGIVSVVRYAPRISRTGLFDRPYYEAQCGRRFRTTIGAIAHYVAYFRSTRAAGNPLMEPEWAVTDQPGPIRDPIIGWIRGAVLRKGFAHPTQGPLFDPDVYLQQHPEAARHRGGPLAHFLSVAGPDDPLPVPVDHLGAVPTWGQARQVLFDKARESAGFDRLRGPRRTDSWDRAADAAFVRRWTAPHPQPARPAPDDDLAVTVVMPVRDRAVQVLTAIGSVRAQTFGSWELIVVDDGSTDGTAEAVEHLARQDPRIRLIRQPPSGVSAARNAALAAGRGDFAAFLDSDNEWLPHFLEVMVGYLRANRLAAGHSVVDSGPDEPERYLAYHGGLDDLLVKNHIDLNSFVVDRRLALQVGGFDETLRRWVDHDLLIRVARHGDVPLVPFVGVVYDHDDQAHDRITNRESDHWQYSALGKNVVDWTAVDDGLAARVPGRVSISMPTYQDWSMTLRAVRRVLDAADAAHPRPDVEVIVVDNGSRRCVSSILAGAFLGEPRVRLVSLPRNLNFAIGSNLGFARSTGETVIFLNNDTEVSTTWLEPLLAALDDTDVLGAQPLLLYPDGTIQSAGTVLLGGDQLPSPLLVNHAPEDARRAAPIRLSVVTAAALAMRAPDVAALRGFDPIFVNGLEDVDLCLRAVSARGGRFAVATDSVVVHHESKSTGRSAMIQANRALWLDRWRGRVPGPEIEVYGRVGLEVAHLDPGLPVPQPDHIRVPRPVLVRPARLVLDGPAHGLPSLRWAIKIAAHAGPRGDSWGDVHFARALQDALTRLGQDVVVDRRDSHDRPTSYLDDVVLTVRGLDDVAAHPGRVNLLWIISHPELVTPAELRRYDSVFAASQEWASRTSAQTRVPVQPLLQATDPARFAPDRAGPQRAAVLFVGNSRKVFRPIVRDALAAGLDLSVYGEMWEPYGLGDHLRGTHLPNEELGRAYASAGVVLCDHWTDMAREGFVSNRIFDAVASGACVVSDPVDGLDDLFDGAVQVYSSVQDLARLCGPEGKLEFPDGEGRRLIAERVRREHAFDARARVLLDAAVAVRADRAWLRPGG